MDGLVFQFAPFPEVQAIEQVTQLNDAQFETLRKAVNGKEAFDRSLGRCRRLAEQLDSGLNARTVYNLLGALKFLYDRLHTGSTSEEDFEASLNEFLEFSGLNERLEDDVKRIAYERLLILIRENTVVESATELNWLKTGIIDTAADIAFFVDLRLRYSEDFSAVEDVVPLAILRIAVATEYGPDKAHVFQISKEWLRVFRTVIDDIDAQFAAAEPRIRQILDRRPSVSTAEEK